MENTHLKEEELDNKNQTSDEKGATPETEANQPPASAEDGADAKLKEELAAAKDKYIRLYSEFENFRRRTAKEKLEMVQSANAQLITALLPVLDDFERAEKSFRETNEQATEGFLLISAKYKKILESNGVKAMDIKQGSDFNPDVHEAITQIPADPSLKGKIVEV